MKKSNSRLVAYLKRNAVYLILAFCIIAVGLSITLMLVNKEPIINNDNIQAPTGDEDLNQMPNQDQEVGDLDKPNDTPVIVVPTYVLPVSSATKITEYSDNLVFNPTLKRFESHKAVDFFADEGTQVFAVSDGTVVSVENSFLEGYSITIDHGNGLTTVYNSLSENTAVSVGQKVASGDVIGEVSITNRQENNEGAHLHFYMLENGVNVNPEKYLTFNKK